jgi:hypothetical protein
MKSYLEKVRVSDKSVALWTQVFVTIGIIISGFALGILQKWIDGSSNDILPALLQQLDIRNYFGRLPIWILLATIISVYSKTPLRASINTFLFFISMLVGYYLYCNYALGFLPKTYMMIWVVISFASFFMAYICWYAKGNGIIAIVISSVIIGVLFSQAFIITQGFYVTYLLEVITWGIGVIILHRKPKEYALQIGLSLVVAFVYQLVFPYWG